MLKVAEEYGVSSVALGKVCRKLAVPVPGRGHWAKLAHGHRRAQTTSAKLDPVPVIYRSNLRRIRQQTRLISKKIPSSRRLTAPFVWRARPKTDRRVGPGQGTRSDSAHCQPPAKPEPQD